MKVSGFKYCLGEQHRDVDIFKTEDDKYFVKIGIFQSPVFESLSDLDFIWGFVEQIEKELEPL